MSRAARPYHHGDLRNTLLSEAARAVESDGVASLSLRELARRLGVSHAAPLNHFADKEALLAALAAQGFDELSGGLAASATRGRTPAARLREIGREYVRFALRRPGHYLVMFGRGASKRGSSELEVAGSRMYDIFQQVVVAAMPPQRARSAAKVREASFLAWSVVHGAAMLALDGQLVPKLVAANDEDALERLVDYATSAVAATVSEG